MFVYRSFQAAGWESIDMADARHPQTLVAYGMNGGELPVSSADLFDCVFRGNWGIRASNTSPALPLPIT